jgi:hypothetical protein
MVISTLASVAGVGRTRASGLVAQLHRLGLVDRRDIGRTTMVSLARDNTAGDLIDRLAHLRSEVIDRLRILAAEVHPSPLVFAATPLCSRSQASTRSSSETMSPRGRKRHPVSPADARAYLAKASAWLEAAEKSPRASRWDVAAGSAVTAAARRPTPCGPGWTQQSQRRQLETGER